MVFQDRCTTQASPQAVSHGKGMSQRGNYNRSNRVPWPCDMFDRTEKPNKLLRHKYIVLVVPVITELTSDLLPSLLHAECKQAKPTKPIGRPA